MRQIVLDTETTGLEPSLGHRIIEVGCVELVDRKLTGNHFHRYINPEREVDEGALRVHGLDEAFLKDKPLFHEVVGEFLAFVRGSELIIHNASFDIGFLDHELRLASERTGQSYGCMADYCSVLDTLILAREMHPGQRNSLDALCKRYGIDNSSRQLHGALLDSQILAEVYLAMTGGQVTMQLNDEGMQPEGTQEDFVHKRVGLEAGKLPVPEPDDEEKKAHRARLDAMEKNGQASLWRQLGWPE
jgi:DNA polymerase-3 subunit epsilon